uniref:Spore coat protein D n=1 Tax=Plectus sambesii TaxID=2011161 RepID=A0A914X0N9_9BILA
MIISYNRRRARLSAACYQHQFGTTHPVVVEPPPVFTTTVIQPYNGHHCHAIPMPQVYHPPTYSHCDSHHVVSTCHHTC